MEKWMPVALLALLMLLFPQIAMTGAREGLLLWFQNVLPAQFPFMVCILFLLKSNMVSGKVEILPIFLTGSLSGYPGGAKAVEVLYREGRISRRRLQWLMSFCNNASPLFIVGTVGTGILKCPEAGYRILAAHLLSAMLCGCVFLLRGKGESFKIRKKAVREKKAFGAELGDCVAEASEVMLMVGGFMMLYSVLIHLCETLWPAGSYLYVLLEMTNGAAILGKLPLRHAVPLIGALVSMGGLAVYSQTCGVLGETPFSGIEYLAAKCLQGGICGIVLWIWERLWPR